MLSKPLKFSNLAFSARTSQFAAFIATVFCAEVLTAATNGNTNSRTYLRCFIFIIFISSENREDVLKVQNTLIISGISAKYSADSALKFFLNADNTEGYAEFAEEENFLSRI